MTKNLVEAPNVTDAIEGPILMGAENPTLNHNEGGWSFKGDGSSKHFLIDKRAYTDEEIAAVAQQWNKALRDPWWKRLLRALAFWR